MSYEKDVVSHKGQEGALSPYDKGSFVNETVEEVGPVTAEGVPDSHR